MEINFNQLFDTQLPKINSRLPRIRVKSDIPKIKIEEENLFFTFDKDAN